MGSADWIGSSTTTCLPSPARILIDAANTMRGAAAIGAAKPYLADTIARHILEVERATYATPECRNVAIGHAINSLDRLFPIIAGKRDVQLFVSRQMDNTRTATRKKAERFLRKWPLPANPLSSTCQGVLEEKAGRGDPAAIQVTRRSANPRGRHSATFEVQ
jgi:hypothetical protein